MLAIRASMFPLLLGVVFAADLFAVDGDRAAHAGQSDVTITGFWLSPATPELNQTLTITVNVENLGESSTADFLVEFYADRSGPPDYAFDVGDSSCVIPSLGPGGSGSCDVYWDYTESGIHETYLYANREYAMWESDETNNISGPNFIDLTDTDSDGDVDAIDNCPSWYNPTQVLPLWPVSADDPDCDGFSTALENVLETDPTRQCPVGGTPDAWPVDFNKSGVVNITDVLALKPVIQQSVPPASPRFDLNASGVINITDVLAIKPFIQQSCS